MAVASTLAAVLAVQKTRADFEDQMLRRQLSLAHAVSEPLGDDVLSDDRLAALNHLDDILTYERDVKLAYIVGLDGKIFVHTSKDPPSKELLEAGDIARGRTWGKRELDTESGPAEDFAYELFRGTPAEVHFLFDEAPEEQAVYASAKVMIAVGVVLFLAMVGVIHALDMRVIRPLEDLTSAATSWNPGCPPIDVKPHSDDEIGQLAAAFSGMQERLRDEFQRLESARAAYRTLARKTLTAQEQERTWVAAEVHDSLLQHMIAIQYWIQGLERDRGLLDDKVARRLDRLSHLLDEAVSHGRNLIGNLRPPLLEVLGLRASLREQVFTECRDAQVHCDFSADALPPLDPAVEIAVYRVVQESLTNALKHARPTSVEVRLCLLSDAILASVADDGRGFDVTKKTKARGGTAHLGIQAMVERTETLGGTIQITSRPGHGTTVAATFPLIVEADLVAESLEPSADRGEDND